MDPDQTTTETVPSNGTPDRAAILAEMSKLGSEPEAPKPDGESEPAPEPEAPAEVPKPPPEEEKPDDSEGPEAEDETEDEVEEHEGEEEDTKVPAGEKADLDRRLEAVQKREKRAKEAVAREREEFTRRVAAWEREWQPKVEQAEQFAELSRRVRHDPVGVLMGLGLTEDDLDPIARVVYAHSKEARQDPKLREAAQRSMRERELADQVAQLTRKMEERDRRDTEREQQATLQRETQQYLDAVAKSATDDTPLVKTMLEKNAERTRARLAEVAHRLIADSGEVPEYGEVVAELEKIRRAELEELGIDPDVQFKRTKKSSPTADEKRPAKTLTNDLGKSTSPRSAPVSRKEELADVKRALEEGRLE